MTELYHRTPVCTGEWQQDQIGHWRCTACGVLYYRAPDVHAAARLENSMGAALMRLTREGRKMQEDFGPREGWEG